jgi:16S rRNA (uracil1498-N3)-methyltransferase
MAKNIFLPAGSLKGKQVRITGEEYHYLKHVLRVRNGLALNAIVGGRRLQLRISAVQRDAIVCEILDSRPAAGPREVRVHVYLGMLKSKKMDVAVARLSELGAETLCPLKTERTVVGGPIGDERHKRWEKIAKEGAKVSGKETVMRILPVQTLERAVKNLERRTGEHCIVFSPIHGIEAKDTDVKDTDVKDMDVPGPPPIRDVLESIEFHDGMVFHLFFGPEGGFTGGELSTLIRRGAACASMGDYVLKSETAAIVGTGFIRLFYAGL